MGTAMVCPVFKDQYIVHPQPDPVVCLRVESPGAGGRYFNLTRPAHLKTVNIDNPRLGCAITPVKINRRI